MDAKVGIDESFVCFIIIADFFQTINKKLIENYMEDHPEIKDMLADYVQTVLQLKPEDVFEFTAKYFLAFTPALLPQSEYFEGPFDVDDDEDYEFWKYL
jgi:hypothetical protein